jgi:hypothetical protein
VSLKLKSIAFNPFELKVSYSRMYSPASARSALGRVCEVKQFMATADFIISPGGRALVEFK